MQNDEIECKQCGGNMVKQTIARHNQGVSSAVILLGIAIAIMLNVSFYVGIPVIILGIALGISKKKLWICSKCGIMIERFR